ncbi:MATE family efflux transporter [Sulfurimonas sp. SAG-AH-194-C21]|nr:MATE family efflux transporter [Sulfurimonas sp. SAG-AH-194-C21]MDF1883925.1 MATE family efflux transporter [Sulfurimonas sp. SAG-AH-194-C21]
MHTDLTQGSIKTHLITLSIPAMTGYFFHTMFNVTDTVFAGLISTEALAALSLSASVFFMILAIGIGMSEALTSLVGNALGEKNTDRAQHIALNSIIFAVFLSLFLSISGVLSVPYFIGLLGDPSYVSTTLEYINIILYATIFFIASFFFNALLNATGDTKSFRNILIFTSILNIFLNYLFVSYFEYGVRGIAIATVIAEFLTMSYLFYKLKNTKLWRGYKGFKFDISVIKELLKQGFPPSMNMFMMAFGMYIITYFVAPYGKEAVAAFGIGMRVEQIFLMPVVGLGIATLAIVAQNNGAQEYKRIEPTLKLAMLFGFSVSLLGVISFFTLGEYMVSFLTSDPIVIQMSVLYLKVCGFGFFGFVVIFISISMLQGIKKPAIIFPISVYRQVVAPIILFSVVAFFALDIFYLWLTLDFIVLSAALYLLLYAKRKLNKLKTNEIKLIH